MTRSHFRSASADTQTRKRANFKQKSMKRTRIMKRQLKRSKRKTSRRNGLWLTGRRVGWRGSSRKYQVRKIDANRWLESSKNRFMSQTWWMTCESLMKSFKCNQVKFVMIKVVYKGGSSNARRLKVRRNAVEKSSSQTKIKTYSLCGKLMLITVSCIISLMQERERSRTGRDLR